MRKSLWVTWVYLLKKGNHHLRLPVHWHSAWPSHYARETWRPWQHYFIQSLQRDTQKGCLIHSQSLFLSTIESQSSVKTEALRRGSWVLRLALLPLTLLQFNLWKGVKSFVPVTVCSSEPGHVLLTLPLLLHQLQFPHRQRGDTHVPRASFHSRILSMPKSLPSPVTRRLTPTSDLVTGGAAQSHWPAASCC